MSEQQATSRHDPQLLRHVRIALQKGIYAASEQRDMHFSLPLNEEEMAQVVLDAAAEWRLQHQMAANWPEDWRTMETAPRTGQPILLWDPYYLMRAGRWCIHTRQWLTDLPYEFERGGKELPLNPTRWMPLPHAPKGPGMVAD